MSQNIQVRLDMSPNVLKQLYYKASRSSLNINTGGPGLYTQVSKYFKICYEDFFIVFRTSVRTLSIDSRSI